MHLQFIWKRFDFIPFSFLQEGNYSAIRFMLILFTKQTVFSGWKYNFGSLHSFFSDKLNSVCQRFTRKKQWKLVMKEEERIGLGKKKSIFVSLHPTQRHKSIVSVFSYFVSYYRNIQYTTYTVPHRRWAYIRHLC